jgi:hypothetical protein
MNSITVDVSKVLTVLKKNKDDHIQKHKDAIEGYWAEMLLNIEKLNGKFKAKEKVEMINISLSPPISYEDEYETAIQMLQMHTEKTIEMSKEDFERTVLDKWEWKHQWSNSNSKYWDNSSKAK